MIAFNVLSNVIGEKWAKLLYKEFKKSYMVNLSVLLKRERSRNIVYPPQKDVFNAYKLTPYDDIKILVLGQDPYHQPNQAHGLAFSVADPYITTPPPSLRNIMKEVEKDIGFNMSLTDLDLTRWATQGVFLLNTSLTVVKGKPNSHKNLGWLKFTGKTIELVAKKEESVVFMLWGNNAKSYKPLIENNAEADHLILTSSHPSPFSYTRGFKDSMHFKKANEFLEKHGKKPINWI